MKSTNDRCQNSQISIGNYKLLPQVSYFKTIDYFEVTRRKKYHSFKFINIIVSHNIPPPPLKLLNYSELSNSLWYLLVHDTSKKVNFGSRGFLPPPPKRGCWRWVVNSKCTPISYYAMIKGSRILSPLTTSSSRGSLNTNWKNPSSYIMLKSCILVI